ncbi:MAG TPA: class I tRNA ligase family protein, partial [Burkholderiales bacterium]|nr:class I tRNA ligase family protein [Burkholderiales bacterium]
WLEMDRYAVALAAKLQGELLADYGRYEFHLVSQKLHNFLSEDMGAFYLDVLKDRLYTAQADGVPRRSAQTALHHIAHSVLRLFAPILSFTSEEAWGHLAGDRGDSVFLHGWHALPTVPEAETLLARWSALREAKAEVQKRLEELRVAGSIGSSLGAEVEIRASGERLRLLQSLGDDLRLVLITSAARVRAVAPGEEGVTATPSAHAKCERCWHLRSDVGADGLHPTLCGRCVSNLFGAGEPRRYA